MLTLGDYLAQYALDESNEFERVQGPKVVRGLALARLAYNKALTLDSTSVAAYIGLANTHRIGDLNKALHYNNKALELDPGNPKASKQAAEALIFLRRFAEAEKVLRAVVQGERKDHPESIASAREQLGRVLARQGEFARSEQVLNDVQRAIAPDDIDQQGHRACLFQAFGSLYLRSGRALDATERYRASADLRRDDPDFQFIAAVAEFTAGRFRSARRYADRALALLASDKFALFVRKISERSRAEAAGELAADVADRTYDAALWLYGNLGAEAAEPFAASAARLRDTPESRALLRNTVTALDFVAQGLRDQPVDPLPAPAWTTALRRFDQGDFAGADDILAALPAEATPTASILVLRGFGDLMRRDVEHAKERFAAAAKADADDRGPAIGRAHLAMAGQDYKGGAALLADIRSLAAQSKFGEASDYPWILLKMALYGRAWAYAHDGRHKAAIAEFNKLLTRRPNDELALIGKANSLVGSGELQYAKRLLDRVLRRNPRSSHALALLGAVHRDLGDAPAAEAAFKDAIKVGGPALSCPYEGLGLMYLKQGRLDDARTQLDKAIAASPNTDFKKYNGLAKIMIRQKNYAKAGDLLRKSIANYPADNEARKLLATLPAAYR